MIFDSNRLITFVLLATSLAICGVSASPHQARAKTSLPAGYKQLGPAPSDETITFRIALPQKDFAGLEGALLAASTPGNAKYGQHLTKAQVNALIAPATNDLESVQGWLSDNGLASSAASPAKDWITVNATVARANKLLQADFMSFSQQGSDQTVIRTLGYTIPKEVEGSVLMIHPTVTFPVILPKDVQAQRLTNLTSTANPPTSRIGQGPNSATNDSTLPDSCIRDPDDPSGTNWEKPYSAACRFDAYGIPKIIANQTSNSLWVTGVDNEFVNKVLLKEWVGFDRPEVADSTTFNLVTIDGGLNNQLPGGASPFATGSMRVVASTAPGVPLTFMSVGTDASGDPLVWYLDQVNYLLQLDDDKLPKVVLGSGWPLREDEVDPVMATQVCNAFAQLAARGVSVINAGGYGGVEGIGLPSDTCTKFDLSFPDGCPYITTVGATTLDSGEELPPDSSSSFSTNNGGFSDLFARPAYQDDMVGAYLDKLGGTYEGMFNASGRAAPDISASEWILPSPGEGYSFGSSVWSSALVAAMVALINDELIAKGKPTLGFLNPLLYKSEEWGYDMTSGSNPGCNTDGFSATVGWDPVTGVGSPRYAKLRAVAGL